MTITALILRTIGIFFRIYMSNKIGAEGMGLYQLIFSIYVLAATFASSGICTAVTRMVTDELATGTKKSVLRILRRAVVLSALIGLLSAALVFFGADFIGNVWLKDARAIPALKILTPSLPFMGITSCLRGYFIARRNASSAHRRGDAADRPIRGKGHRLRLHGGSHRRYPGGNRLLPISRLQLYAG